MAEDEFQPAGGCGDPDCPGGGACGEPACGGAPDEGLSPPDHESAEDRPQTVHRGWTRPDGTVQCESFTDDNLSRGYTGYPGAEARWPMSFRNRAAFCDVVGGTRRGAGADVHVYLDGDPVSAHAATLLAARQYALVALTAEPTDPVARELARWNRLLPSGWKLVVDEPTPQGTTWTVLPPLGIAVARTREGPAEAVRRALREIASGSAWWAGGPPEADLPPSGAPRA